MNSPLRIALIADAYLRRKTLQFRSFGLTVGRSGQGGAVAVTVCTVV